MGSMASYVSLHTHSEYSLLDGLSRIKDLVAKSKEFEMPAIALTDHGSMHGAIKFYLECKTADIKPIIGMEAYQAEKNRLDKQPGTDKDQYHLILLAKNYTGYKNLMKISTIAHLEGFYYKPRLDWEVLEKYHEGIICTTACTGGLVSHWIEKKEKIKAEESIRHFEGIFGKDNFYLEIQNHPGLEKKPMPKSPKCLEQWEYHSWPLTIPTTPPKKTQRHKKHFCASRPKKPG